MTISYIHDPPGKDVCFVLFVLRSILWRTGVVVTIAKNGRTERGLFQAEKSSIFTTGDERIAPFLSSEFPASFKKGCLHILNLREIFYINCRFILIIKLADTISIFSSFFLKKYIFLAFNS